MKKVFFLIAALAFGIAAFLFLRPRAGHELNPEPPRTREESAAPAIPEHPPSVTIADSASAPEISSHDRAQADILGNILASHNDNDMRLDTDLKVLDEGAKKLFRQKYAQLPPEHRNERGTIVFLLGRNLTQQSDLAFLNKVLAETPCRSMQSCTSDPPHSGDVHADDGVGVTLAYPQLMALKSLEGTLAAGKGGPLYDQALEGVHRATESPVGRVADMARAIEAKYARH